MARRNSKAEPDFIWTPDWVRTMSNRAVGRAKAAEAKLVAELVASGMDEASIATPFKDAYQALTTPEQSSRPRREATISHGKPRVSTDDRIKTVFALASELDTQHPGKIATHMREVLGQPVGYWLNPVLNALFGSDLKVKAGYELSKEQLAEAKALTAKPKPRSRSKKSDQEEATEAAA